MSEIGTLRVKSGLAEMLKGGVIMDVTDAEQARIAEDAGAATPRPDLETPTAPSLHALGVTTAEATTSSTKDSTDGH